MKIVKYEDKMKCLFFSKSFPPISNTKNKPRLTHDTGFPSDPLYAGFPLNGARPWDFLKINDKRCPKEFYTFENEMGTR